MPASYYRNNDKNDRHYRETKTQTSGNNRQHNFPFIKI